MIDYRMQRRLSYIGGGIQAQMSAWPAGGIDTTGLISWWTLDETSGTRNDSHGTNHLTDVNTVLYAAGKKGNAADFERTNTERLSIVDNDSLSYSGDFSIAFWTNPESLVNYYGFMSKESAAANTKEWRLDWENNKIRFITFNGSGTVQSVAYADLSSTATWYFVVVRYNATTKTSYLSVNNGTEDTATGASTPSNTTGVFYIGFYETGTNFDGLMDEVSFWKRILTTDEITWLYNGGAGRAYSDL